MKAGQFIIGDWTVRNRRRTNALDRDQEGVWEEFEAHKSEAKHLDGRVIIDHFVGGTFADGMVRKGITIRTFDEETQLWSLRWLDNRNKPDFSPLVGKFEEGVGLFYESTELADGQPLLIRFTWDQITADSARWQQAFSFDGGKNWETNCVMEMTRKR